MLVIHESIFLNMLNTVLDFNKSWVWRGHAKTYWIRKQNWWSCGVSCKTLQKRRKWSPSLVNHFREQIKSKNFSKTARFYNLEGLHTCIHAHTCDFMFLSSLKIPMRLNTYMEHNQTSASLATKDTYRIVVKELIQNWNPKWIWCFNQSIVRWLCVVVTPTD